MLPPFINLSTAPIRRAGGQQAPALLAVDASLDIEQGAEALHGFEPYQIDYDAALTAVLLAAEFALSASSGTL